MDIEKQVASLEPSKKLKELGVKQISNFYWFLCKDGKYRFGTREKAPFNLDDTYPENWNIPAFTCAESIEALPGTIDTKGNFPYFLKIEKIADTSDIKEYRVAYCCMEVNSDDLCCVEDNKLADALAEIRIYLIENGLI